MNFTLNPQTIRPSGEGRNPYLPHALGEVWVPAFAGMTVYRNDKPPTVKTNA
jgi:hypothetical protein